jgi:thiol-disulfide isomerase/thioredoxin
MLGAVFGVVAIALILAVVFSGSDSDSESPDATSQEFGPIAVSGTLLPQVAQVPAGDATLDAAFGMPIPEIAGEDFSGQTVEIKRDGQPKAILFVSHSCPHCQDEIPEVQAWLEETGGVDGVSIVSVSTSAAEIGGNWPPSEWLAREGWTSPVIADDEELSAFFAYGGSVIPYWVFVDADGNVTRRYPGRLDVSLLELAMMETLG